MNAVKVPGVHSQLLWQEIPELYKSQSEAKVKGKL